jgi:cytochrome c-type biogenesis protein CcmH/NrfF
MSANETMKETIAYTVKHMIAKLQAQGYSEAEIVGYMGSDEGLSTVKRLAEQFWNSLK